MNIYIILSNMFSNLKTNFNKLWKYVVGGGIVLGYQAWYERVRNKKAFHDYYKIIMK